MNFSRVFFQLETNHLLFRGWGSWWIETNM